MQAQLLSIGALIILKNFKNSIYFLSYITAILCDKIHLRPKYHLLKFCGHSLQ